jgi:hypothetical protein
MKNILFILLTCIIFCFNSCSKNDLNVAPDSQLSSATFWRDENDAMMAATGVYATWSTSHTYQIFYADDWSDNAIPTGFWRSFYYYGWGAGNLSPQDDNLNTYWSSIYTVIRSANVFLTNVDKCKMDDALRNRLIGEVKFIRAYEYFLLLNNWGEVPLVEKPLDVNSLKVPRSEPGETVSFILKDLNDAITNLPATPSQSGRIAKGAALSLKARTLLYEGKYAEAAVAAKEVINLGYYQLLRTSKGDGYYQLRNTIHNNNREEIIGWQYDGINSNNDVPGYLNCLIGGALLSPTKSLVDAYDGYNKATDQLVPVDESTTTSRFINRDPRLNYSIAHTGTRDTINHTILNSESGVLASQSTGYGCIKYITDEQIANAAHYTTDNILIRYAEVLLTYAEGKIEANQIDQSVLDAINEVRSRAYGTIKTDVSHYPEVTATDQSTLRDIIRKERRVELAFEGLRWFDLKRWKIAAGAGGTMNGAVFGAMKNDGSYINAGTRALTDPSRDYLRPIPRAQIDLEGSSILEQNPGY